MTTNEWISVLSVGLLLAAVIVAGMSTFFMWNIYRKSKFRSWFFKMLINGSIVKVVVGALVGYVSLRGVLITLKLATLPNFPDGWTPFILLTAAIILVSPPTYYASRIWLIRRRIQRGTLVLDPKELGPVEELIKP